MGQYRTSNIKLRTSISFWPFFLMALSIVFGPCAGAARADRSAMKTILVLGDSLSDGLNLKRSEAYPALLVVKLRAAGLHYEVINASASGGTTEGSLRRLPPHLKRKIEVLLLELATKDAVPGVSIHAL